MEEITEETERINCKKCGANEFNIEQGKDSGEIYIVCRNCLEGLGYLRTLKQLG